MSRKIDLSPTQEIVVRKLYAPDTSLRITQEINRKICEVIQNDEVVEKVTAGSINGLLKKGCLTLRSREEGVFVTFHYVLSITGRALAEELERPLVPVLVRLGAGGPYAMLPEEPGASEDYCIVITKDGACIEKNVQRFINATTSGAEEDFYDLDHAMFENGYVRYEVRIRIGGGANGVRRRKLNERAKKQAEKR